MSQTMASFADVRVEEDGHMDEEDVLVSILSDKEKETVQGVEGVVAEQADDGGTKRTSTMTERLGANNATKPAYVTRNEMYGFIALL